MFSFGISRSTYFHKGEPVVKTLKLNKLKSLSVIELLFIPSCLFDLNRRQHGGQDRALLSFDLHAGKSVLFRNYPFFYFRKLIDLRPAFHWNLKQLFVFVLAEYESQANVRHLLSFPELYEISFVHSL
jgi:hypothetical protein